MGERNKETYRQTDRQTDRQRERGGGGERENVLERSEQEKHTSFSSASLCESAFCNFSCDSSKICDTLPCCNVSLSSVPFPYHQTHPHLPHIPPPPHTHTHTHTHTHLRGGLCISLFQCLKGHHQFFVVVHQLWDIHSQLLHLLMLRGLLALTGLINN